MVDLSARRLLDATTLHQFPAAPTAAGSSLSSTPAGGLYAALEATPPEFRGLFSEFQDVANHSGVMPLGGVVSRPRNPPVGDRRNPGIIYLVSSQSILSILSCSAINY